jgi:hypothetical protein
MRRSVHVWKVLSPCRTGARATKRHQTERPIIALVGALITGIWASLGGRLHLAPTMHRKVIKSWSTDSEQTPPQRRSTGLLCPKPEL